MKTDEALAQFNHSVRDLARALDISVQAVYSWGDTVPQLRAYQLRDLLAQRAQVTRAAEANDAAPQRLTA